MVVRPGKAVRPLTSGRSLGGTVRGDDQPSRYPPRGVWFGLILAACACRASSAQDAPDPASRGPAEPLVLSARTISVWGGPDAQYVYLSGAAAVLEGTDGMRATQAVCRIVNISNGGDPLYEVEVYAEGTVRDTSRPEAPLGSHRARSASRK